MDGPPEAEMKNSSFLSIPFTLLTDIYSVGAVNAEIENLLNECNIRNPGYFVFAP